jgi:UDP-glucose:(heptosyl)LPS alpha-1,3-glucosyltransferase
MKLAFCLFNYFPFGGLQGDFMRIALECQARGHQIIVYTYSWTGDIPEGFIIKKLHSPYHTNHGRAADFERLLHNDLKLNPVDLTIGFNRITGLDLYFAADNCFAARMKDRCFISRFLPRYRTYLAIEKAVFSPESPTEIMNIANRQKREYIQFYGTRQARFHLLPPGIPEDRKRPVNADELRTKVRKSASLDDNNILLIQVGSGFKTKGIDRAIKAIAALPDELKAKIQYWVVGKGKAGKYKKLAKSLGLEKQIVFTGGRDDVPELLLAADLMIHPSRNEAAGNALLEAMTAGLPVLCTAECGFADFIERAQSGRVVPEPFEQSTLDHALKEMLASGKLAEMAENGLKFAEKNDFYSRHKVAADIIDEVTNKRVK